MGGDDTVVGSAVRDVVEGEGRGIVREELLDVVNGSMDPRRSSMLEYRNFRV